ncbi:iron-containing alcohol dehydrogenase [Peribacillus deserti]|uniref:iron-containing alcohol dehydrogenase n=1 Tax=Peribacillus deserti TaxID=673318 RepID=UPI0021536C01|nr:iron-containing alcohol dehydrogenase [Peribacillus deserti]
MLTTTLSQFMLRTGIYSGSNTRALVPDLFRGLGAKRVVLFSDCGLEKAGIVDKVAQIFQLTPHGTGPELAGIYLDISQDAESRFVNAAARYAREVGADGLLAVGGGSVLDTVKGVKYALHKGLTDIKDAIPGGSDTNNSRRPTLWRSRTLPFRLQQGLGQRSLRLLLYIMKNFK